jgi:hypothetical protein
MATVRKREEEGSDVNVPSHLLFDVLVGVVDAAIVVTNDSDLELPLRMARSHVPVGTVNPSTNPTAGALKGRPEDGWGGTGGGGSRRTTTGRRSCLTLSRT